MSKKRATETTWESSDEILLEDTSSGLGTFSMKDEEYIDEDALLGIGESTDNAFNNDLSYEIQLDDSATAMFDITGESQEVLDYEDTFQEGLEESAIQQTYPDSAGSALVVDSKPNLTTTKLKPSKIKAPGNESDNSDSEEEKKGRNRFKTERQSNTIISTKHGDIPDKLEVTKEMQDQIESFEKQKNQRGRPNQRKHNKKQQQQQQRQFQQHGGQMNRHNAGQMRHPRPGGPRFMHQQRGPNPNFRHRQPLQRGPGPNHPRGFMPGPAPQPQGPRPLMQQGPVPPYPHEMVGQNNFSAPQPFPQSQPQQMIHSGPSHMPAPTQAIASQSQFNPAPASLVHSSAVSNIHVNPKFHGSQQPPVSHHQQQPPHSVHHTPYPPPQQQQQPPPQQQQQQPGFMPGGQRFQGPRPVLLEAPRPLMMTQQHGPPMENRGPGPHGQPMFHPGHQNPVPRHNIPQGQFMPQGGAPHNMPHPQPGGPHQPHMQPRHPHQPQNMQHQRPQHHPGPQQHPNQNIRPQRFQPPHQPRGPAPRHQQPNQNFNPPPQQQQQQQQPQPEPTPEMLAKQREIEERKKRRLERFAQNAVVVPSSDKPTTVKLAPGNKRPSMDGPPHISPTKIAKIEPKRSPADNMEHALLIQKRQREMIQKMKEAKRLQEATNRRKQLEQKLAREGKTLADIEPQPMEEQHQTIPTISGGQQFQPPPPQQQQQQHPQYQHPQQHPQHQQPHPNQQYQHQQQQHQNMHHQQQQQNQHQHPHQQFQNTNQRGGRGGQQFGSNRGFRGGAQSGRGQAISVRGQSQRGRGANVQPGLRSRPIVQGQPISVLGQSPTTPEPVVNTNVGSQGRGQFRGRGRGGILQKPGGQPRSNILQTVQITEDIHTQSHVPQKQQRTVLPARQPARQTGNQQKPAAVGMNSMGAASQGQGQNVSGRVVVANKAANKAPNKAANKAPNPTAPTPKRTVLSNSTAQRRIVMESSLPSGSSSVAIEGLSSNVNLGRMNGYCSSTGDVKNFNYKANERKILVRFANPGQAAQFIKKYNRQMVDLTMIRVKQVPDF